MNCILTKVTNFIFFTLFASKNLTITTCIVAWLFPRNLIFLSRCTSISKTISINNGVRGISELINYQHYTEFFDEVLQLDQNIRLTAIHDGQFKAKYQNGVDRYFEEEEIKSLLNEAQDRWDFRKKSSFKIGSPKFAMARYDKVNRIIIPLGKDGIILVTTELAVDVKKLVDSIIEIRTRFFR